MSQITPTPAPAPASAPAFAPAPTPAPLIYPFHDSQYIQSVLIYLLGPS